MVGTSEAYSGKGVAQFFYSMCDVMAKEMGFSRIVSGGYFSFYATELDAEASMPATQHISKKMGYSVVRRDSLLSISDHSQGQIHELVYRDFVCEDGSRPFETMSPALSNCMQLVYKDLK